MIMLCFFPRSLKTVLYLELQGFILLSLLSKEQNSSLSNINARVIDPTIQIAGEFHGYVIF